MKLGKKTKERLRLNIMRILLILVIAAYVLPFYWMVSTSLKSDRDLLLVPPKWFPVPPQWSNYRKALEFFPFFSYLMNSVIITGGSLIGTLLTAPLAAYGFSKIRWPGRDFFFFLMLSTMMLPYAVTMIPTFIVFKKLGLVNTHWPLIIPSFCGGGAGNIFLIRQFFRTIPDEFLDAARVDGATELQIYWRIMLPLSKPVLLLVGLFTFIGSWNNYLGPLIYLTDERKYPLALGLPAFLDRYGTYWNWMMAAATLSVIPIVAFFFFAQSYLIEGIKLSGLKE